MTATQLAGGKSLQFDAQGQGMLFLDRGLYGQVLENLVSNAARYAKNRVEVQLALSGGMLLLAVEDDGSGFSEEARTRAAEPYYREAKPAQRCGKLQGDRAPLRFITRRMKTYPGFIDC